MTNKTKSTENAVKNTTIEVGGDKVASIRTYVVSEPLNESFVKLLEDMVETIVIKNIAEEKNPSDTCKEIESTTEEISGKLKIRVEAIMLRKFKQIRDAGPLKLFELYKARMSEITGDDGSKKEDTPDNTATESGETEDA